jgi:phosphatidate cytidylyltransferase
VDDLIGEDVRAGTIADLLWIVGLVIVGLTIATLVARSLRGRADADLIANVETRIASWWGMTVILGIAALLETPGLVVVFGVVSALAFRELVSVAGDGMRDPLAEAIAQRVVLPGQYLLILIGWYGLFAVLIPVYAFLALPLAAALRGPVEGFVQRVAAAQWGLMVGVFCLSHLPALMMLDIPGYEGRGVLLVVWVILTVQLSDVLQFIFGKLTGRRPVAPRLSPSKTWEGFVGGTVSAAVVGALLHWMTPWGIGMAFLMALILVVLGFAGGLILSAVKRDRGVKDWGTILPGHGGVVDRVDSLVFSAPVFFHIVRYFWSLS